MASGGGAFFASPGTVEPCAIPDAARTPLGRTADQRRLGGSAASGSAANGSPPDLEAPRSPVELGAAPGSLRVGDGHAVWARVARYPALCLPRVRGIGAFLY